jgi:transketolase
VTDLALLVRRITGDEKHAPSVDSSLDVLWILYDRVLRVSPDRVDDPGRDRFVLSKGHGPAGYYAVLAAKGFIPDAWLDDVASADNPLGHHPDRRVPGVEVGTGSLGHGLGVAIGMALGLRVAFEHPPMTYVLLGDGELDEGSNHEAIAFAGATGLDRLVAIVIDNRSSTHGWPGGIASRFTVNGWTADTIDRTDLAGLERSLSRRDRPGPHVVVVDARGA